MKFFVLIQCTHFLGFLDFNGTTLAVQDLASGRVQRALSIIERVALQAFGQRRLLLNGDINHHLLRRLDYVTDHGWQVLVKNSADHLGQHIKAIKHNHGNCANEDILLVSELHGGHYCSFTKGFI